MKYSIIVPAYNEGRNIEAFVDEFIAGLSAAVREVLLEIILVENGSRDDTLAACNRLHERHGELVRVLSLGRGSYGGAIRLGMENAQGTHLSILECDFLDGQYVAASIQLFNTKDAKFIVASKRHPDSIDNRPFKRRVLTNLFNKILNAGTGYPGSDTHGLKSIETELARRLCAEAQSTDEILQTEIVLLAYRWGNTIYELPIAIREKRAAPVSIRKRFPMVVGAIKALRQSVKRYPKPCPAPQIIQVR